MPLLEKNQIILHMCKICRTFAADLLSIFFPQTCPMCGRYIGEEVRLVQSDARGILCADCLDTLPRTEQAELRENLTEMTLTGGKVAAKKAMHLERAAAFLFYDKEYPIRRVIHLMKYADQPMIGFQLGRQAAMEMQYADFFDGIEVIMPIPLHKNRLRSRGYNQSEYIAYGLSSIIGIPVDTTHLKRVKDTPKQALQDAEGRKTNVAGAFAVNHPEQMYHKHILLVDDLLTTGETMKACLQAMKAFRGATFSIFALCKAR